MGVLKRFFKCSDEKCNNEWDSIAYQMEDQQCPKCTKIAHYHKTKQKKKNGFLLGTYECKGRKDKKCGKIWKSAVAFKGSWQQCRRCDTKCHPVHVIEHDYEDVTTIASSSICSELADVTLDANNNQPSSAITRSSDQSATVSDRSKENNTGTDPKDPSEEQLPKRQVHHDAGHIMAKCGECISLGELCVRYYEFIRNPEKEKAAKKKADKLRPMLKAKMYEEQGIHLDFIKNFLGKEEQKQKLQKIEKEQPPSSGSDNEDPPPQPPMHKRRYRKRRPKKAKITE